LAVAVSGTTFNDALKTASIAYGATDTVNAQATGVTSSAPVVVAIPVSSNDDDELSGGAIAGIVIGVLVFVALVGAGVWYLFFRPTGAEKYRANDKLVDVGL
jgi:hypothetical protein